MMNTSPRLEAPAVHDVADDTERLALALAVLLAQRLDALFERVRRLPGSAVSALRPLVAEAEHVRGKLIEFATPVKK